MSMFYFIFENTKYFNTHICGKMGESHKETDNGVHPKEHIL